MNIMRSIRRGIGACILAIALTFTASGCISIGLFGTSFDRIIPGGSYLTNLLVDLAIFVGVTSGQYLAGVAHQAIENGKMPGPGEFSPEQQYYIGRGVSAALVDKYKMANPDDPKVQEQLKYLNQLGGYINVTNPDGTGLWAGVHIGILESPEPAAYATPGGYIWITRGALMMVQTEEELAALICHEMAHVAKEHAIQAYEKAGGGQVKPNPWIAGLKNAVANSGNLFGELAEEVGGNKYGPDQETEADQWALFALVQAGYSHEALFRLLERVDAWEKKHPTPGEYLKNHPTVEERIEELKNYTEDSDYEALFKTKPDAKATSRQNARFKKILH
jgi:predicted Zn-dependent protease